MKIQNLQELKETIDIVEVISKYIKLRQTNQHTWNGLCPFHDDHVPSLWIWKNEHRFKCFGCETGGDVFTFMQKIKKISFPEAINEICKNNNIQFDNTLSKNIKNITEQNKKTQSYWNTCRLIANSCYHSLHDEINKNNQALINFLNQHDLTSEIIEHFQIGFIPDNKLFITEKIVSEFKNEKDKVQFIKNSRELGFDNCFFSECNKIVIPIQKKNNIISFDIWDITDTDSESKKHNPPKNSILFQKQKDIFNLDNLKTVYSKPLINNKLHITFQTLDAIKLFRDGEKNVISLFNWPQCNKEQVNAIIEKNIDQIILHLPQLSGEFENNNVANIAAQFMTAGITNIVVNESKNQQGIFQWCVSKLKVNNDLTQEEKLKNLTSYIIKTIPKFAQTKIITQHLKELNSGKSFSQVEINKIVTSLEGDKINIFSTNSKNQKTNSYDTIRGFVNQIITRKGSNGDFQILKLVIPNKVYNTHNMQMETAYIDVNFRNNPELNDRIKELTRNDYITVKGNWRFYNYGTENRQILQLGFSATELQIIKKTKFNETNVFLDKNISHA